MRNRRSCHALALGLALLGWAGLSRDAEAAYARPANYWDRRSLINGNGGCRVPYTDETDTDQVRDTLRQVIAYINIVTPCVWEPKQWWESDYVAITENDWNYHWFTDLAANSGGIGKIGGRQEMHICHGCNDFQLILHELGHSMGLMHEFTRTDRNDYVWVDLSVVRSESQPTFWMDSTGTTLGLPFDQYSVMMYDGWAFMDPAWAPYCWVFGCRTIGSWNGAALGSTYFTDTDLEALRRRYPTPKRLTAMHSGKCVDVPGGAAFPQTIVTQYDCHQGANQGWLLRWWENAWGTDYYVIETADPNGVANSNGSGLCLDVQWASQAPLAPLMLWECYGGPSQEWSMVKAGGLNNGYKLVARHSGQCLDVFWSSPNNGAWIVQAPCTSSESQIWGMNYRPERLEREVGCRPGEIVDCQYDVDLRRVVCDCVPAP
jgi:astacin (peptidase family M12A)/ricin-type beta-trefoil lectin protein